LVGPLQSEVEDLERPDAQQDYINMLDAWLFSDIQFMEWKKLGKVSEKSTRTKSTVGQVNLSI